jgi:hypothetical protein
VSIPHAHFPRTLSAFVILVVAPAHDALMVEGSAEAIDDVVAQTQAPMTEASAVVLAGFRLRSDVNIV